MELAVRREPHPVARPAIRFAHRADEADHTARIGQFEIARLIGRIVRLDFRERPERRLDSPPRLDIRDVALDR